MLREENKWTKGLVTELYHYVRGVQWNHQPASTRPNLNIKDIKRIRRTKYNLKWVPLQIYKSQCRTKRYLKTLRQHDSKWYRHRLEWQQIQTNTSKNNCMHVPEKSNSTQITSKSTKQVLKHLHPMSNWVRMWQKFNKVSITMKNSYWYFENERQQFE